MRLDEHAFRLLVDQREQLAREIGTDPDTVAVLPPGQRHRAAKPLTTTGLRESRRINSRSHELTRLVLPGIAVIRSDGSADGPPAVLRVVERFINNQLSLT